MISSQLSRLDTDVSLTSRITITWNDQLKICPSDVVAMILKLAFDRYHPSLSRVCRRFRQFFNKQITTWRFSKQQPKNLESCDQLFRSFPNIKQVEFAACPLPLVKNILQQMKTRRIKEITIRSLKPTEEERYARSAPLEDLKDCIDLEKVKIIDSIPNINDDFCTALPPSVVALSFLNINLKFVLPTCQNLQHLDLRNCPETEDEVYDFPTLKTIRYEASPEIYHGARNVFVYTFDDILRLFGRDKEWTEKFISLECDIDITSQDNITALYWVCKFAPNPTEIMKTLIQYGANVNFRNDQGETLLHLAVEYDRLEVIKLLLASGSSVNCANFSSGSTPLHFSMVPEITRTLIRAGANVNAKNFSGCTPLHKSLFTAEPENLQILLAAGADAGLKNNDGLTPLALAKRSTLDPTFAHILRERP